ncbi:MAG: type I-E CRISPR-associated protein Cas7/Cse4/CasC [Caldilineaceae bacterium]
MQALKRAIRRSPVFADTVGTGIGERTKLMARPIKDQLVEAGKSEDAAISVANAFVTAYASKMDEPGRTSVLVYFSQEEVNTIVQALLDNWEAAVAAAKDGKSATELVKEIEKKTEGRTSAADIALFGRMLAEKPTLNIDAACQVAHAISTHRVNMEMDFYTAVDDLQSRDEKEGAGAGMIGFTNFNSACFYRYTRIDWRQLTQNLGWRDPKTTKGDPNQIAEANRDAVATARRAVEGYLRAVVDAIPTGKQNTFAAQNPTNLALALVRKDGKSWNLANAFEEPVRSRRDTGYIRPSIEALDAYWGELCRRRDDASFEAVSVMTDMARHEQALDQLAPYHKASMSAWVAAVLAALPAE